MFKLCSNSINLWNLLSFRSLDIVKVLKLEWIELWSLFLLCVDLVFQMYRCLTAPIDSLSATQLLSELKDGGCTPAAEQRGEASGGAAAGEDQPPSGSSSGQSQDSNKSKTVPPLNPFMVPLSLLVRQAESTNSEIHRGVRSSLF